MKTPSIVLSGILLGLGIQSASATVVTVNIQAHVVAMSDPTNVFGGQVIPGQAVTATYTYDTSAATQQTFSVYDQYVINSPPASLSVSTGPFTFQTESGTQLMIAVQPSAGSGQPSYLAIASQYGQPLASGTQVGPIQFDFEDTTGQWPASLALPTVGPAIQNFSSSRIMLQVGVSSFVAQIDSAALAAPPLEVSPATSSFLSQQHFDFALLLAPGTLVATAQLSANGHSMYIFPGPCQLAAPNSANRPALYCPDGDGLLGSLGAGPQQINFLVALTNGTVVNETVVWTLIQ